MRRFVVLTLLGMLVLPGTALAQKAGPGITRDQYIERARERAAQNAARRFDQMDTNHDGVLDPSERRAWREQHRMSRGGSPLEPPPQ